MNRLIMLVLATLSSTAAMAQHEGHRVDPDPSHDMHEHRETAEVPPRKSPPPEASSGSLHAADALFDPELMEAARSRLRIEEGGLRHHLFLADRLEAGFGDGDERFAWDLQGWYGGDIHRLWFKSEGEGDPGDGTHELEVQALYSRAISPFFDAQLGVRYDVRPDPDRSYVVAGIQGLLPFVFELDAALFLSEEGDLSGRVETEYDLRITQRLVMQPRLELDFAAQATPELGIGSGFSSVEAGVRLRYELRREIAPYAGIAWERKLGDTADFARASGEDTRSLQLVLGVRFWF